MTHYIESAELKRMGASDKALWLYNTSDPCEIIRNPNDSILLDWCGDKRRFDTDKELLDCLDSLADAMIESDEEEYMGKAEYIDQIYIDEPSPVKLSEIARLAEEWQKPLEEVFQMFERA